MDRYPYDKYTILLGATRALAHLGTYFTHRERGLCSGKVLCCDEGGLRSGEVLRHDEGDLRSGEPVTLCDAAFSLFLLMLYFSFF